MPSHRIPVYHPEPVPFPPQEGMRNDLNVVASLPVRHENLSPAFWVRIKNRWYFQGIWSKPFLGRNLWF